MLNPEPSEVVGRRVRDLRRRAGLSADQVAERVTAAGLPLTGPVVYLIEGGGRGKTGRARRRVTVEELFGLAYALRVSPLTLLLPAVDGEYEVTPEITTTARDVYEWLVGERLPPLPTDEELVEWTDEERAVAWLIFTQAVSYVPEPSAHWLANGEYERLKQQRQGDALRRIADVARDGPDIDDAIVRGLAELITRVSDARTTSKDGGTDGESEDQADPGR